MGGKLKEPKQNEEPNLSKSPKLTYGGILQGLHKEKQQNHSRENKKTYHEQIMICSF